MLLNCFDIHTQIHGSLWSAWTVSSLKSVSNVGIKHNRCLIFAPPHHQATEDKPPCTPAPAIWPCWSPHIYQLLSLKSVFWGRQISYLYWYLCNTTIEAYLSSVRRISTGKKCNNPYSDHRPASTPKAESVLLVHPTFQTPHSLLAGG